MTGDYLDVFFTLHRGLPREGPGVPEDVAWASALAEVSKNAQVLDAAFGPVADIAALRRACPKGTVRAVDQVAHFVDEAQARTVGDPKVAVVQADMAHESGVADHITTAGCTILGQRRLSDAAWEAYHGPIDATVAALKPKAAGALADVLAEAEDEARIWRTYRDSFGYTPFVVRPV
jgi:hypothetical protein